MLSLAVCWVSCFSFLLHHTTNYCSPTTVARAASALNMAVPQTTLSATSVVEPHTTLKPVAVLLPQTTDVPQTTELPDTFAPQTTDEPQTTELGAITELPFDSVIAPLLAL